MLTTGFALSGGLPLRALDAVALLGEAADHGCAPVLATEVSGTDAAAVAAAVAALRPRTALGVGIIPLGSRTLPAIAMAASTVAGLSEREFLLGVGVSTSAIVAGWHGAPWRPSIEATRERLVELRRLLDGGRRGSFRLGVPPGGRVRLLLGALGPRMVELGLQVADGVICNLTPPEDLPAAGGARVYAYVWVAAGEPAEAAARRDLVAYATATPYARHFRRLGFGDVVDEVATLRAGGRLREAPGALPSEFVDRLVVRPHTLAAHAAAVHAAGAVPVALPFVAADAAPADAVRRVLAALPRSRAGGVDAG